MEALELLVDRSGARVRLLCPDVGVLTGALPAGALVAGGSSAGVLVRLGRSFRLVVPEGVEGRVAGDPDERVHAPRGYGDLVCEVEELRAPATAASGAPRQAAARSESAGLVVRAPSSGRFWQRPAPGADAFVAPGALVREGQPVGLLEVMKTFGQIPYRAQGGLPALARVVRVLAADGADVKKGDALVAVEAATGAEAAR